MKRLFGCETSRSYRLGYKREFFENFTKNEKYEIYNDIFFIGFFDIVFCFGFDICVAIIGI
ncbi:MAG: hypothetical protein LBJ00_01080 [Planctomycetaceae bacterium]|nr:hypothetical protein [Planctomycetaceae bacterium]